MRPRNFSPGEDGPGSRLHPEKPTTTEGSDPSRVEPSRATAGPKTLGRRRRGPPREFAPEISPGNFPRRDLDEKSVETFTRRDLDEKSVETRPGRDLVV